MTEKLAHPDWEFQIAFEDGSCSVLVLENPVQMRSYVVELLSQCRGGEGSFVFSLNDEPVDISKKVSIVTDPLNVDPTNKVVTAAVQQMIKTLIISSDHYKESHDLLTHMEQFADSIAADCAVNVVHPDYDVAGLSKMLNFQLQVDYQNELERVMEFMNVMHDLCSFDCFVFISAFSLFSSEELDTLINEATSNKHNILFIEAREPERLTSQGKKFIIDKDFCQIF